MARKVGMQWDKGYGKELVREIKNYNARLRTARKKYPDVKLPSPLKASQERKKITTVKEYRAFVKDIKKATAKTLVPTKQGITKYEANKARLQARRYSKAPNAEGVKRELLEKLIVSKPGKFPSELSMLMREMKLREGNKDNLLRAREWLANNQGRAENWRANYLKAILENMEMTLSVTADVNQVEKLVESYKKIYNRVAVIDIEDFLIGQMTKPETLGITYIYPNSLDSYSSVKGNLERIYRDWTSIL